jgi:hypothetical protein
MRSQPLGFTVWNRATGFFDVRAKERDIASLMLFLCKTADYTAIVTPLEALLLRPTKFNMLCGAVESLDNTRRNLMRLGGREFREGFDDCYRARMVRP